MRKILLIITLFTLINEYAFGQSFSVDLNSAPKPDFWWRSIEGDSTLNFNNTSIVGNGNAIRFDSIPYAKDYTMVVVYQSLDGMESSVWRMEYADSVSQSVRGLTTERIVSDGISIRYSDSTVTYPAINTLRQSAPDSVSAFVRLILGGDTLDGTKKVSEIMYFTNRLGHSMLRRVQSALAVRYGVTLGPVDYLDGNGRKIWNYAESKNYHHRITGIGRDSTYQLNQLRSTSEMSESILTLTADSLKENSFLVVGDDNAPLVFNQIEQGEILQREWRMQATEMSGQDVSMIFDPRRLPSPNDSLVLILDEELILPSSVTLNEVRYDHIVTPDSACTFTLGRGSLLWQEAQLKEQDTKNKGMSKRSPSSQTVLSEFNMYPNPTTGDYTIEVVGAEQVQVVVYTIQGKVVATFSDEEKTRYVFRGSLPSGNIYFATVTTENGSQTMKLVVK